MWTATHTLCCFQEGPSRREGLVRRGGHGVDERRAAHAGASLHEAVPMQMDSVEKQFLGFRYITPEMSLLENRYGSPLKTNTQMQVEAGVVSVITLRR